MISKKLISLVAAFAFSMVMLTASIFGRSYIALPNDGEYKSLRDTVPVNDTSIEGKIFEKVDEEAYFPGSEQGWRSYLEQNLNPAVPVLNGAPAGLYTVYIQFIVDLDGKLSAIKPLTKHGYGMESEVMRIIRKSPPWIPAVQHGKSVRAYRKQPVTFQIVEEKKKKRKNN